MKKYLVWIERKPGFSGNAIPGHRVFLQSMREAGKLVMAGGFSDKTGGAYILQAESQEEAGGLVNKDPMFVENECVYHVKEWDAQ